MNNKQASAADVRGYINAVRRAAAYVPVPEWRAHLQAIVHYWACEIYEKTGTYPIVDLQPALLLEAEV